MKLGVWLFAGMTLLPFAPAWQEEPPEAASCVVLLHGLWRSNLSMKALEWTLREDGYRVVNLSYPSTAHSIEELAEMAVGEGVRRCRDQTGGTIHMVSHSLGGILIRAYLAERDVDGLGRVVMIGPPNQGSQLADFVSAIGAVERVTPPAVQELSTVAGSFVRKLGPVNFDLGVIAGTRNRRPFTPGAPDEASDGTVAVAETRVEGMNDYLELPVTHTFMIWDQTVLDQTAHYLRVGRFRRDAPGRDAGSPVDRNESG